MSELLKQGKGGSAHSHASVLVASQVSEGGKEAHEGVGADDGSRSGRREEA